LTYLYKPIPYLHNYNRAGMTI